jgi:16S rRNA processing protein RimM
VELEDYWDHKGRVILKFAGVDSISEAETLIGCEIQISREDRAELEPGAVYVSDLKDCAVLVIEAGGEREIGRVDNVVFGAGEAPLLMVRQGEKKSGKEYLIPFAEEYIQSSDLDAKRIVMVLPEGMLELDAPLSANEKRRQQSPQDEDR